MLEKQSGDKVFRIKNVFFSDNDLIIPKDYNVQFTLSNETLKPLLMGIKNLSDSKFSLSTENHKDGPLSIPVNEITEFKLNPNESMTCFCKFSESEKLKFQKSKSLFTLFSETPTGVYSLDVANKLYKTNDLEKLKKFKVEIFRLLWLYTYLFDKDFSRLTEPKERFTLTKFTLWGDCYEFKFMQDTDPKNSTFHFVKNGKRVAHYFVNRQGKHEFVNSLIEYLNFFEPQLFRSIAFKQILTLTMFDEPNSAIEEAVREVLVNAALSNYNNLTLGGSC